MVFDLGNVLIAWDPHRAIAAGVGAAEATRFLDEFDFPALNHQLDEGRPLAEWEAAAAVSHPQWAEHVTAYRTHFPVSVVGELPETVAVLGELKATGIALYALTNWSAELFPVALERFGFLGLFDDIVVSGEVRVAKPDPRVFAVLAERTGTPLDRCLFVDDKPENVAAAADAGMDAVVFVDAAGLREALVERGLLDS